MPFITLSTGAGLDYVDVGMMGEPFVLLHGMLGTPETHLNRLINWLSLGYRVIAPALRGYGASTPKPRDFPPDFYHRDAADVIALLDALGIPQAHVAGFSDGGEITLVLAAKYPDRVRSAVAWGAPAEFGPLMHALINNPAYPERLAPTAEEAAAHGITDRMAFAHEWIAAVQAMIDTGEGASQGLAPQIVCPLLVMLGEQDTLNPFGPAGDYVAQAKHGQLATFDCGHAVHDQVWDEFKAAFAAFLNSLPQPD